MVGGQADCEIITKCNYIAFTNNIESILNYISILNQIKDLNPQQRSQETTLNKYANNMLTTTLNNGILK